MSKKLTMTLAVAALAANSVACHLQIDQIMEVQEGSQMELGVLDLPPAVLPLEGGTVMSIDVTIGLFDLLFGKINGDVAVPELLIASPSFLFLGAVPTGNICVVPTAPGSGTFEADLFADTATFDVSIDTIALLGNPVLAAALPGGGFAFPFHLMDTVPFGLAEAFGFLTGSGDIEITTPIDLDFTVQLQPPLPPISVDGHVGGVITLASAEAFPTSPLLDACIASLGE